MTAPPQLFELRRRGDMTTAQIATRLNELGLRTATGKMWTAANVQQVLVRAGRTGRPVNKPLSREEKARAEALLREGLPSNWVAEDIGRDPKTVHHLNSRELHIPAAPGWHQVWAQIRRRPGLLALHYEFSPEKKA